MEAGNWRIKAAPKSQCKWGFLRHPSHNFPLCLSDQIMCCVISLWLVGAVPFSTSRKGVFACKHFLHAKTLLIVNLVLAMTTCPSTQEEHPQLPIPACCPRISGSPQTRMDSVRTHSVSLIHNSQFRCTERTTKIPVGLTSLQGQIRFFLKVCRGGGLCSDWLWCAHGYGGYGWQC